MPPPADRISLSPSPFAGLALALAAFAVWTLFSVLPGLMSAGGAFRLREAWDTGAFWTIGAPLIALAQALAGAIAGGSLLRQPLWTLGGFFAGVLLVHPRGNDLGLLPLALIFIGVPAYLALLALAWLGRKVRGALV